MRRRLARALARLVAIVREADALALRLARFVRIGRLDEVVVRASLLSHGVISWRRSRNGGAISGPRAQGLRP